MSSPGGDLGTGDGSPLTVSEEGTEFFGLVETYLNRHDRLLVREAFEVACREHGDQRRQSGELFLTHPLSVAYYLARYSLDAPALMAALLHDVAEDTRLSVPEIKTLFGAEVSRLVDGVTKLKEVSAGVAQKRQLSAQEVQYASLRKMFEAMTIDIRVVLIKLFDRLHNMRTLHALPQAKQRRKAEETLSVYAPLANRLGIWRLKTELEALAIEVLDNTAYRTIRQHLELQFHKRQALYATVSEQIIACLMNHDVNVINVFPSPESIYSLYRTLSATHAPYYKVESPLRVVVLLEDVPSCYLALGYLHQLWRPLPGKFDDYIALPRENLYRALHTTVIHASGEPLKIRFRTVAMHEVSEIGVLARWVYAGTPMWTSQGIAERVEALFANVREVMNKDPQSMSQGVQSVVDDVFSQQIMVYTPRGDVIEMPLGATPVDFAYAIHTEVGNQCLLAYVNEQPYPLNRPLNDGDQVRIVKSGWARPQRTWLDEDLGFLGMSQSRSLVRRWFRRLPDDIAIIEGEGLLRDELALLGMADTVHGEVASIFGFEVIENLYYALGHAELLPTAVATRIVAIDWYLGPLRDIGREVQSDKGEKFVIMNAGGRDLRLCQACNARPGDSIVGFVRSDGGVTVHKDGCYTLRPDPMAEHLIKLSWGKEGNHEVRLVTVQIDVFDRSGLLFEIAQLLQGEHINISAIHTPPRSGDGRVRVILEIEVTTPRQLVRFLHRARALVNVFAVYCLTLGTAGSTPDLTD